MCGICGLVGQEPLSPEDVGRVRSVNAAMFHRGPDGDGELVGAHVMLAMRRLAIIDLAGGWQPLFNEDRSIAVVANGEVYNYVELRRDLESRGHVFRTKSDCETIAHAYEEYGLDFVHKLRGMYAIALYDSNRRRIVLVRDRMGEKPLYLFQQNGRVLFASEMKAILASGMVPFELDPVGVNDFFHFQYVPDPATPVVGVRKLPAGHMMVIDLDPWRVEERCYWKMEDAQPLTGNPTEHIREVLEEVGRLIIRSDVPVGVALSGGLDSSMVAALAAKNSPKQIHALSIGYAGRPHNDERAAAKALADHLKMPFHDFEVPEADVLDSFADRNFMRDDPIADISGHGYYAVSRLARERNIPVLLQGHGIDELFWGYDWVRNAVTSSMQKCGRLPVTFGDRMAHLRKLIPEGLDRRSLRRWAFVVGGLMFGWRSLRPSSGASEETLSFYNEAEDYAMGRWAAPRVLTQSFREKMMGRRPEDWFTTPRPWPDLGVEITKAVCKTYLLENGMQQGDRLSMAWAIELRLPFVDYRLVETAIGLRKTSPDHMLPPKARFREVIRDYLPDWVLTRPKSGFTPPIMRWINAITQRYSNDLANGYLIEKGVLDPRILSTLSKPHSRVSVWPSTAYKAMVLEFWARGMQAAARYRSSNELLSEPRPRLTKILNGQERFAVKPSVLNASA